MARKAESYEEILLKLKLIVDNMENNELTLEESMKQYEEGVKLSNKLYGILNKMESKINILNNEKEEEFGGNI